MTTDIVFQNDNPEGSREDVLGCQKAAHMHNCQKSVVITVANLYTNIKLTATPTYSPPHRILI
jgi:hypothetical protein